MDSYLVKGNRGGISPYEDKGPEGAFKFGTNLDIRKKADTISCNQALINEGEGVISDLIKWIVPVGPQTSQAYTYLFGDGGNIYKRTSEGVITVVYNISSEVTGAIEFENASGTFLIFATEEDLHCKKISTESVWNDVDTGLSGFPYGLTASLKHDMKIINGSIYICNGNKLAMLGYDGSWSSEILTLVPNDFSKCLLERDTQAIIGTYNNGYRSDTHLYSWDTVTDNYGSRKSIPADSINCLIDTDMELMQIGTDGTIYYSDGVNKLPLIRCPGGGQCNPQGVESDNGLALFGIYGATTGYNGVYSYGRRYLGQPVTLNLDYALTCDEIGAICKVDGTLLISYKQGTTYGLKVVDGENKVVATYESLDLKTPYNYKNGDRELTWGPVEVETVKMPANTAIECWYRVNKDTTWLQANLPDGTTSFDTENATQATFNVQEKGKIFEYKLQLTPSGNISPEIIQVKPRFA